MRRSQKLTALIFATSLAAPWTAAAASLPSHVVMPELSESGGRGRAVFATRCATCHGFDAGGTNTGPSLIAKLYGPEALPDDAIVSAIRNGQPQKHWEFGAMPEIDGLSDAQIYDVISFIREVQKANGIK